MPIRQGRAKLWFNTKEEEDEYDDKMISSIQIQTMDFDDDNFVPVFNRKRQEFFLELSDTVASEIKRNVSDFVEKYHLGKRDHTYWREWTIEKFGLGYAVSYLLIRELPIRNFYARAWIMLAFLTKVLDTSSLWIGKGVRVQPDQWNHKTIKNYGVYYDWTHRTMPTLDGKLPEEKLWKLNQPGYLRPTVQRFFGTATAIPLAAPKEKIVAWDGTFNMPLEGLASPKHKDGKWVDFIYE